MLPPCPAKVTRGRKLFDIVAAVRGSWLACISISLAAIPVPRRLTRPRNLRNPSAPCCSKIARPVHNPANPKNRIDFLKAETVQDAESRRGLWADVAVQFRNRTMPPVASKLTEEDRLHVATWLWRFVCVLTACRAGDYAGAAPPRRLNRREYHNTIRDLLGVDLAVADFFPPMDRAERFRYQWRDALRPADDDGAVHASGAADSRSRDHYAAAVKRVRLGRDGARRTECARHSRAVTLAPGQEFRRRFRSSSTARTTCASRSSGPRRRIFSALKVDGAASREPDFQRDPTAGPRRGRKPSLWRAASIPLPW